LVRKLIPWPSLFGMDDVKVRENDVVNRRRAWTWRWFYRVLWRWVVFLGVVYVFRMLFASLTGASTDGITYFGWVTNLLTAMGEAAHNPAVIFQGFYFLAIMLMNFVLFLGPLLAMGISQIRGFEPGDAEWGVKLEDIRG